MVVQVEHSPPFNIEVYRNETQLSEKAKQSAAITVGRPFSNEVVAVNQLLLGRVGIQLGISVQPAMEWIKYISQ